METSFHSRPSAVLRLLVWLRTCAIAGQITIIGVAHWVLDLRLPIATLSAIVGLLTLWNLGALLRLSSGRAVGRAEVAMHLAVDIAALGGLLYFTGGSANPFASLLLVPVAIAAAALPGLLTCYITALCAGMYTLLLFHSLPLHEHGGDFRLHMQGMWVNFLISAIIIAVFLSILARLIRRQDRLLADAREEMLRNEHVVKLGTMAAGTAHEIGTPLSTMSVVLSDLREDHRADKDLTKQLDLMVQQIHMIKDRLTALFKGVGTERGEAAGRTSIRQFLNGLVDRWRLLRPEVHLTVSYRQPFADSLIASELTLEQAILNLLNNAADASQQNNSDSVHMQVCTDGRQLGIAIQDEGPGLASNIQARAGTVAVSTKESGLGIGLVLSNASINRYGGRVTFRSREPRGSETLVELELEKLVVNGRPHAAAG